MLLSGMILCRPAAFHSGLFRELNRGYRNHCGCFLLSNLSASLILDDSALTTSWWIKCKA